MLIEVKNVIKKRVKKSIEESNHCSLKEVFKRVLYLYMFKPDDYEWLANKYERLYEACLKNREVYGELVDLSKGFDEKAFDKVVSDDIVYNEKIRRII